MAITAWLNLAACSLVVDSATENFATNLSQSILQQNDPETVKVAVPSYLILLDAMIYGNNNNTSILRSAALLNSSYASLFIDDSQRQMILIDKSINYATTSLCLNDSATCGIQTIPYSEFEALVDHITKDTVPDYYALAACWASWIQLNSNDWNAIAQLPRVEQIMQRIVDVNETYQQGGAHIYLGVIATLLPPAMGGRPEIGKLHFEKAIALSSGKNLMAKVIYAERYSRLIFNRKLHDRLLNEVLQAKTEHNNLSLMNAIAKHKAQQLLDTANDYF